MSSPALQTSARLEGWEDRLLEYFTAEMRARSRWGVRDCCTFAAGAIGALTGVDPSLRWRGRYRSLAGALAFLEAEFGGGVEHMAEFVAIQYNFAEILPAQAWRGDVVLFETAATAAEGGGPGLGVVDFNGKEFLARERRGLKRYPLAAARRAWRIA